MPRNYDSEFESVATFIQAAERLSLFEGLPHQTFERAALESELTTARHFAIARYPFYTEPIEITSAQISALQEVLGNAAAYRPFSEGKLCGGFHPDFAIRWQSANSVVTTLLCFGCEETLILFADQQILADLSQRAFALIFQPLRAVRQNRPGEPRPPLSPEALRYYLEADSRDT